MSKQEQYQLALRNLPDWTTYLENNSNLPGPRANLELAYAAGFEANLEQAKQLLESDSIRPAGDSPQVFLILCGVISLARLSGQSVEACALARKYASDDRWRLREAVAIGMQFRGDIDSAGLLQELRTWMTGNLYEQRAVVASLCEPRLLKDPIVAEEVVRILDQITTNLVHSEQKRTDAYRVLRQALGYGWSVAIVAAPQPGKESFFRWAGMQDQDIRWIVRENLKKNRLIKFDPDWVRSLNTLTG